MRHPKRITHTNTLTGKTVLERYSDFVTIGHDFSGDLFASDGSSSSPTIWGRELVYAVSLAIHYPGATILTYTVEANDPVYICLEAERQSGITAEYLYPAGLSGFKNLIESLMDSYRRGEIPYNNTIYRAGRILDRLRPEDLPGNLVDPPRPENVAEHLGVEFAGLCGESDSFSDFIIKSKHEILCYLIMIAEDLFGTVGTIARHTSFEEALSDDIKKSSINETMRYISANTAKKKRLGLSLENTVLNYVCPFCCIQLGPAKGVHSFMTDHSHVRKYRGYTTGKAKLSLKDVHCNSHTLYFSGDTSLENTLKRGVGLSGYAIYCLLLPVIMKNNTAISLRNYRKGVPYLSFADRRLRGLLTNEYCLFREGQQNFEVSISGFELFKIIKNWYESGMYGPLRKLFLSPFEEEGCDWNVWEINDRGLSKLR